MTIPQQTWIRYKDALAKVDKKAAEEMAEYVRSLGGFQGHEEEVIEYAFALATKYGEAAAALACEMYDAVAELSGEYLPAAVPAETASYDEVARTMRGVGKGSEKPEAFGNATGRLVKQAGADTTLRNALRDGAEFAWVPSGDTCAFCIMLASNGWQRASKKAVKGGHAEHVHTNCDCTYAIRFDGKGGVAGYDPEKYRAMYEAAEGDTWREKLNSMRRADYAEHREEINAQKRAAYAERVEREKGLPESDSSGKIGLNGSSFGKNGSFSSKADPMADVFGPGIISHPKEIEGFRRECKDSGVAIIHRDRESINYEPSTIIGKPGQIVINEDASYSAWCHEMQHMRDDRDNGWDGALAVWDRDEHYRREQKAYEIEIQLARRYGREDIAELLLGNLEEERRRIYA